MAGYRIQRFKGNSCEIGLRMGYSLKGRLKYIMDQLARACEQACNVDAKRLERESASLLARLPEEYLLELESMAYGSGVKIERIAKWVVCGRYASFAGAGFIYDTGNDVWSGSIIDGAGPSLWRYVYVIEKECCFPAVIFGLEGELFPRTGYNSEKLWLHCNSLAAWDEPDEEEKAIPPNTFIRMALHKCRNLADLEHLLQSAARDCGMNLFAVDGKNRNYALYECTCKGAVKKQTGKRFIAATNNYADTKLPRGFALDDMDSRKRLKRLEYLLETREISDPFHDFTAILADPEVERDIGYAGTVYACLSNSAREMHYLACNGFPAASQARFEEVTEG